MLPKTQQTSATILIVDDEPLQLRARVAELTAPGFETPIAREHGGIRAGRACRRPLARLAGASGVPTQHHRSGDLKMMKQHATAALIVALLAAWALPSAADSTPARCEIYPKGSDKMERGKWVSLRSTHPTF